MTFSLDWDLFYDASINGEARYPNLEKLIIAFVGDAQRMLELGVGGGGEIPFYGRFGYGYHGIDGSPRCVEFVRNRYPVIAERIKVADFTNTIPFDGQFDLIVDRASVPHNDLTSIRNCLALVYEKLKPGGLFISSDWFSTKHNEFNRGDLIEPNTRAGYQDGQFVGCGKVHFSDEAELVELFREFDGIFIQERTARRPAPSDLVQRPVKLRWVSEEYRRCDYQSAWWDLVVRKPL